jgi:hypothetical protein
MLLIREIHECMYGLGGNAFLCAPIIMNIVQLISDGLDSGQRLYVLCTAFLTVQQ